MKPVLAVVPHFNNAEKLPSLLNSIEGQGYADAIVLDDASTVEQRVAAQGMATAHNAKFIPGEENRGPGGNRNRIIESDLWRCTYLHFLDADVTLDSQNAAERVQEDLHYPNSGMGGGLIKNPDGSQMAWNFGPSFTVKAAIGSLAQMRLAETAKSNPEAATRWRNRLSFLMNAWPDTVDIHPSQAFFVAEANMYISRDTLADIGGFSRIRFHDIQGPAIEIARRGLRTTFNPDIAVTHHSDGKYSNQIRHAAAATAYLIRRYGLTRCVFGGDRAAGKHNVVGKL